VLAHHVLVTEWLTGLIVDLEPGVKADLLQQLCEEPTLGSLSERRELKV
jgi:hypothetical protein